MAGCPAACRVEEHRPRGAGRALLRPSTRSGGQRDLWGDPDGWGCVPLAAGPRQLWPQPVSVEVPWEASSTSVLTHPSTGPFQKPTEMNSLFHTFDINSSGEDMWMFPFSLEDVKRFHFPVDTPEFFKKEINTRLINLGHTQALPIACVF